MEDSEAVVVEADLTQVEAGPAPDIPRDRSAPGEAGFRYASMRGGQNMAQHLISQETDLLQARPASGTLV